MKKFLAVMFAVMFAFSALAVGASAETAVNVNVDGTDDGATYVCDLCGAEFTSAALRDVHYASQNPVEGHKITCDTPYVGDDGKIAICDKVFESRAALAEHQHDDTLFQLAIAYFKSGDIVNGCKTLIKAIIEFVQGDTFAKIVEIVKKAIDFVKGIPFADIVGKVKDVAGKIPMDKIVDGVKGIVG